MWWRDRHIYHGRLLAAGHKEGINNLDLFDAACLVLAELHRLSEQTGFTYNSENVAKMKGVLAMSQRRPEDAVSEARSMREEMERAAGVAPADLPELEDPVEPEAPAEPVPPRRRGVLPPRGDSDEG